MQLDNGYVRILEGRIKFRSSDKASIKISSAMRGVFSWLIHTYAGRRTLNFVKQEARSKLKRRKNIKNFPKELERPGSLLKLEVGIRIEGDRWMKELAAALNFREYSVSRKKTRRSTRSYYTLYDK